MNNRSPCKNIITLDGLIIFNSMQCEKNRYPLRFPKKKKNLHTLDIDH